MSWVKFHGELRQGAKRGLPRAVRFVYLELCHEARAGRGVVPLPVGMGDLEGLQDLLGGDRSEVKRALALLTSGSDPLLTLSGPDGERSIVVVSWAKWNAGAVEPPGASTARSQRHREACNGDATAVAWGVQRSGNGDATVMQRSGNARSSVDQIRSDQIPDPPVVPRGGTEPEVGSLEAALVASVAATKPKKPKASVADRAKRGTPCPPSTGGEVDQATWLAERGLPALSDRTHGAEVARLLDHHRAKGTISLDWAASWRTWRSNAARFGAGGKPQPHQGGWEELQAYGREQAERDRLSPPPPVRTPTEDECPF